jgi:hypothetical protein
MYVSLDMGSEGGFFAVGWTYGEPVVEGPLHTWTVLFDVVDG